MRTLPLLSLILLLALVVINGFFVYNLFLKDKLADNKVFSPQSYLDRGLQVIFEPKGKVVDLPPPNLPPPSAWPVIASTSEATFTTKKIVQPTPVKTTPPPPATPPAPPTGGATAIKQALSDLRVVAGQFYASSGNYQPVCAGNLINDNANDDLARIVGAILASRNLSSQFEAGINCQSTPTSYQVSVSLPDGSAWCVSHIQAGYVCAL